MNLFIDTNIFLSFYHLSSDDLEELRKLGVLLEQKRVTLFLTDQVVAEFRRNRETKLADALKGFKEQRLKLQFPQICKDYDEYNTLRDLQRNYEDCHAVLLDKISKDVSGATLKADATISVLFAKATKIPSTAPLITRAKLRYEVGNPPGKDRSLGDAINWEALLEHVPQFAELHLVSDDRDYVSALDENQLKEFLLIEWAQRGKGAIRFYRRLSSFFKEHFPDIKLASELVKELAVQEFAASGTFAQTHIAIGKLAKHTQFTNIQANDIVRAAVSNNQIWGIIQDPDVKEFLTRLIAGRENDIEEVFRLQIKRLLEPPQPSSPQTDTESPF